MRLSGTKTGAVNQYRGLGNQLWDLAGNRPSLDLPFSDTKSLIDATTGTNLIDFSRASSGTYVGSDGLIKTATTNYLTYSENFLDASYVLYSNVGTITRTSNQAISPDGTLTADKIVYPAVSNSGNYSLLYKSAVNLTGTHTASIYLKGETGGERIYLFYTVNGVYSSQLCVLTTEWQRFELTFTGGATSYWHLGYDLRLGTDQVAESGGTVYAWGAQLEQSSTVGEYVKTTSTINSAPRFDHDPTTGESLGLLVEESRINRFQWSNSAVNGETWNNVGSALDLQTGATDPAGGANGIIASDATNTNTGSFLQRTSIDATLPANTVVTYSVWVKPISTPNGLIILNLFANGVADSITANFINTGGVLSFSSSSANGTGVVTSASAIPHPNGWYRLVLTGIPSTTVGSDMRARINLGSYLQAQGTPRFYWYGAQLETGLVSSPAAQFVTSYIPTAGSTVTRAADVASITGTNFSSWYRQDEGTVFANCNVLGDNESNQFIYSISDGALGDEIRFFKTSANSSVTHAIEDSVTGSSTVNFFGNTNSSFNTPFKAAHAFTANDSNRAVGGTLAVLDNSVTIPPVNQIRIGARVNSTFFSNIHLSRLTYWQTRLPDPTLSTITQ